MTLNKSQKKIVFSGLLLIASALVIWLLYGGEIFTKTEILLEKQDELLGTTYKEWEDKFVLGLDFTAAFIGAIILTTTAGAWFLRSKK